MSKIIWTNHALQRIKDRRIPQSQIDQTVYSPDSRINNEDGSIELVREFGHQKVHAIIKENNRGENILLSCWINPPNLGTTDYKNEKLRKDYRKASNLKKMWMTLLNQLGF